MEIICIIGIVTLALFFTGKSWKKTFSLGDKTGCNHDDGCQGCCGCGTPPKGDNLI